MRRLNLLPTQIPRRIPTVILMAVFIIGILGAVILAKSYYIPAKATLAQVLIKKSYNDSKGKKAIPPWPWADTYPVARLLIGEKELFVLEGTNMRNLAFGPTRVDNAYELDSKGTKIVIGHRDTHFSSLARLRVGSEILLETPPSKVSTFVVDEIEVVHRETTKLPVMSSDDKLILVTCYPFDVIDTDPEFRYIVTARRS